MLYLLLRGLQYIADKADIPEKEKTYAPRFMRRSVKDILPVKSVICNGTYDTGSGIWKSGAGMFGESGNITTQGIPRRSATNAAHGEAASFTIKSNFLRDWSRSVLFNKCSHVTLCSSYMLINNLKIPSSIPVFITNSSKKSGLNGTWYVLWGIFSSDLDSFSLAMEGVTRTT